MSLWKCKRCDLSNHSTTTKCIACFNIRKTSISIESPPNTNGIKIHNLVLPPDFGVTEQKESNLNKTRVNYKSLPRVKLFAIPEVMSTSNCNTLIEITSTNKTIGGYKSIKSEYPTDYRKCQRVTCKSYELANIIWNKIKLYFDRDDIENIRPFGFGNDGIWRPTHINEVFRFTKYRNNDYFKIHRDGAYVESNTNRSVYTLMIYLNDNNDFDGGKTIFYSPKYSCNTPEIDDKKENYKLFLSENDQNDSIKVEITPKTGMAVIFNHDVWHEGCTVNAEHNKYKYILRTDIMFQRYFPETFNVDNLLNDPLFLKSQYLYKMTVELQDEGKTLESTISYLKALSIQTALPSIINDKNNQYFGAEYEWFPNSIFEHIFGFLDVYRLINVSYVSRGFYYHATSPVLWKKAYNQYFGAKLRNKNTDFNGVLFRPWKHIFSYRIMMKKTFPVLSLNIWFNAIEIGQISKDDTKCEYIPFATSRYRRRNSWGCDDAAKETFYGKVIFKGNTDIDGFSSPQWIIDKYNILNGINLYKILKEILCIPNIVISLPVLMYTNQLFIQFLKYTLTKFVENDTNFTKIFCLCLKSMEEEVAKYYKKEKCIVIINEHRSFSVSVVRDYKLINDDKLMKKYIAETSNNKLLTFPNDFMDYKFLTYHVMNLSNFKFTNNELKNQTNNELKNELESCFTNNAYEEDINLYDLPFEYIDKLQIFDDDNIKNEIVNDIYCGPNKKTRIKTKFGSKRKISKRDYSYYHQQNAPFIDSLCYSPMDIICALNDVLNECENSKLFDVDDEVAVILIGPLTKYYSVYISTFINHYNGFNLEFISEYIKNCEGDSDKISNRSSALQTILQTVISPKEISNFIEMSEIIEECEEMEQNIKINDAKTKIIREHFDGMSGLFKITIKDAVKSHFNDQLLLGGEQYNVLTVFQTNRLKKRNYGFRPNDNIWFIVQCKEYELWRLRLNVQFQLDEETDFFQQACTLYIDDRICSSVLLNRDTEIAKLFKDNANHTIKKLIDLYVVGETPTIPMIKITYAWTRYDDKVENEEIGDDQNNQVDDVDNDDSDEWSLTFEAELNEIKEENEICYDLEKFNQQMMTASTIVSWKEAYHVETEIKIENMHK